MGHFIFSGAAPYPLVATRGCKAANDDHVIPGGASPAGGDFRSVVEQPSNPLDYLPGPLRQSVIQLLASTASVALPELCAHSHSGRQPPESWNERFGRVRRALRESARQIVSDVGTAGLGDVVVEIIGAITKEIDIVCRRLLRAMRHSMFPILSAVRALLMPDPNIPYRDAMDGAIRLFVQAGIVGSCVLIEQQLDIMVHKVFPAPYVGLVISCFMAFICIVALKNAMRLLDRLDPVGSRKYHELVRQIEVLRLEGREFDRRLQGLLLPSPRRLGPVDAGG
jgi:hypothetical protein